MFVLLVCCQLGFANDLSMEDFQGTYVYVPTEKDKKQIQQGLERSVSDFNLLMRPVVRHVLGDAAKIASRVEIEVGESLTLTHYRKGEVASVKGPWDQELSSSIRSDLKHVLHWNAPKIERVDTTKDGGRKVVYSLSEDKNKLSVWIKMFSPQLQTPFVYSLTYQRQQ